MSGGIFIPESFLSLGVHAHHKNLWASSTHLPEIRELRCNSCAAQIRTILHVLKPYVSELCHFADT